MCGNPNRHAFLCNNLIEETRWLHRLSHTDINEEQEVYKTTNINIFIYVCLRLQVCYLQQIAHMPCNKETNCTKPQYNFPNYFMQGALHYLSDCSIMPISSLLQDFFDSSLSSQWLRATTVCVCCMSMETVELCQHCIEIRLEAITLI